MATKARVLCAFKELHRTCQSVYGGNGRALKASRWKINTDFRRFKDESCPKKIENHIQLARDASRLVRLTAVQGAEGREETPPSRAHSGSRTANYGWQSERRPREEHFQRFKFYDSKDAKSDRKPNKNFQRFDDDMSDEEGVRHWAERGTQKHREAWGSSEYPNYANLQRSKPQHKKKAARHVDSTNFDLSKMTGKKR